MRQLKRVVVGLVTAAALVSGTCYAQAQQREWMGGKMDTGLYLGASVGQASAQNLGVTLPSGIWFDSTNTDKTDFAWKLYAGFPFYPGLAIELGYTRLGRFSFNGTTPSADSLSTNYRVLGYNADFVAQLALPYKISLLARIGGYFHETSASVTSTGAIVTIPPDISDRRWSLKTGLGLQYDISRDFSVRAEAERYNKLGPTKLNLDLYSVGLIYRVD